MIDTPFSVTFLLKKKSNQKKTNENIIKSPYPTPAEITPAGVCFLGGWDLSVGC
ncbi:MAG: hypothetical protein ACLTYI_05840 [Christensenellales bacterium]|jgi:hypothetical protein